MCFFCEIDDRPKFSTVGNLNALKMIAQNQLKANKFKQIFTNINLFLFILINFNLF